jgi:hypothetical protein
MKVQGAKTADSRAATIWNFVQTRRSASFWEKKLAQSLLRLPQVASWPVVFVAGSDAVNVAESTANEQLERVERRRDLWTSTDGAWQTSRMDMASFKSE